MKLKGNLLICLLMTVPYLCAPLFAQSAPKNIILIIVDDLNDHIFADGHPNSYAPNIAKLTAQGTRFTSAYCSSPLCAPSRISFMTGKDLAYTKIYGNAKVGEFRNFFGPATGNETIYTLPEVLKDTGEYYTIGINKIFHNFFRPEFDNDFDVATIDQCKRELSWNSYIKAPDEPGITPTNNGLGSYGWGKVPNIQEPLLADYKAVEEAIKFIQNLEGLGSAAICDKPFFMALGLVKPHTPHFIPEKYFPTDYLDNIFSSSFDVPYNEPYNQYPPNGFIMAPQPEDSAWSDYMDLPALGKILARENINRHDAFVDYAANLITVPVIDPVLTDSERREILEESKRANASMAYWAAVRYMDAQVGRLMDFLDTQPLIKENSIIILISDHGYSLGEKSHWHKQALWETDIRIPFLIVDPSRPGGQVCSRTVSALDLFPTILDMAGVASPSFDDGSPYLDGTSLVPLLDNPNLIWEKPALSTIKMGQTASDGVCFPQFSVRSESHHYIRYATDGIPSCASGMSVKEEELYELGTNREIDPFEWTNLAADNDYNVVKNYLATYFPDGVNYLSKNYGIRINLDQLPCNLTYSDTVHLSATLFDVNGTEVSPPPGTSIRFRAIPFNELFNTASVSYPLASLDTALFNSIDKFEFQAVLYNSTSGVIAFDSKQILINGGDPTSSTWNLALDDNLVDIIDLEIDGDFAHNYWDFGDTYRTDDFWSSPFDGLFQTKPSQHRYTFPGTYEIQHHILYGSNPNNLCDTVTSKIIVLDDTLFEGLPCQTPGLLRMESLDGDKALVRWAPVFADDYYDLRVTRSKDFDGTFSFFSSNVPTTFVDGLEAGEEYAISVRAICDTARTSPSTSEWSFPFRQKAVPCPPPLNVALDSLTEDFVIFSWDPVPEVEFYEIAYRKDGDPFIVVPLGNDNRIRIDGLDPGTLYGFGVRTHCGQLFSQNAFPGDFTIPINFLTPGIPPLTPKLAEQNSISIRTNKEEMYTMEVYPNPSEGVFQLNLTGDLTGVSKVIVDVYDISGKMISAQISQSGPGNWNIDMGNTNPGTYLIRVLLDKDLYVKQLIIQ